MFLISFKNAFGRKSVAERYGEKIHLHRSNVWYQSLKLLKFFSLCFIVSEFSINKTFEGGPISFFFFLFLLVARNIKIWRYEDWNNVCRDKINVLIILLCTPCNAQIIDRNWISYKFNIARIISFTKMNLLWNGFTNGSITLQRVHGIDSLKWENIKYIEETLYPEDESTVGGFNCNTCSTYNLRFYHDFHVWKSFLRARAARHFDSDTRAAK